MNIHSNYGVDIHCGFRYFIKSERNCFQTGK